VTRPCVAVLGGSFDPVHRGHRALADYCVKLFQPDLLRIVPAGLPWQKGGLQVSGEHRFEMLEIAFADYPVPVLIDRQEIERSGNSYTVETLQAIRAEIGSEASLVLLIGADQLKGLNTWHRWRDLLTFSHICAVSRPGFPLDLASVPNEVGEEFVRCMATPEEMRNTPRGLTYLAPDLQIDISSTAIRHALRQGNQPSALVAPAVLDYIKQHHLYRN
jgi:nicotinate-nucleotide adenylyltransferase